MLDVLASQSRDGSVLRVLSNAMEPWLERNALYMAQNADQVIDGCNTALFICLFEHFLYKGNQERLYDLFDVWTTLLA